MISYNRPIEELIHDVELEKIDISEYEGFIYQIDFPSLGKSYIGKKNFFSKTNVKLGKKEKAKLPTKPGRKPSKKKVIKESNWREYVSSSDMVKKIIGSDEGKDYKMMVLGFCKGKKELTYCEAKLLFANNVLEDSDRWLNDNILAKFYHSDLKS